MIGTAMASTKYDSKKHDQNENLNKKIYEFKCICAVISRTLK
jgi:hypothetical protein